MNLRTAIALLSAALALCGVLASSASAREEPLGIGACAYTQAEEEWLLSPERTPQEIYEAWEVNKTTKCAFVHVAPAEEWEVAVKLESCLNAFGLNYRWTKSDIDACLAKATGRGTATADAARAKHQKKHRHHKARSAHRHVHNRA